MDSTGYLVEGTEEGLVKVTFYGEEENVELELSHEVAAAIGQDLVGFVLEDNGLVCDEDEWESEEEEDGEAELPE